MKNDPATILESPRKKKTSRMEQMIFKQEENVRNILSYIEGSEAESENSIYGLNNNKMFINLIRKMLHLDPL